MKTTLLELNTSNLTATQDITNKEVFSTQTLLHLILLTSAKVICSTYAILLSFKGKIFSNTDFGD